MPPAVHTLGSRALNRALLARQLLLARAPMSPAAAIERLVGMQAQVPTSPYYGLFSRLESFAPDDVGALVTRRRLVRMAVMRGTVHLVTARDALAFRPVVQSALDRALETGSPYGRGVAGVDRAALLAAGRAFIEERPRTLAELRVHLSARWPKHDPASLAYAVHYSLPLVQVPPRGVWGRSGRPTCTTAEAWLGKPLARSASAAKIILRYLAAFGPASVADVQTWSGLRRLQEVVNRLRPKLSVFRDEAGRELFDLPDAPRPDPGTPAPIRFLPDYDNVLLSHADRARVITDEGRRRYPKTDAQPGTILVDGFVWGTWTLARKKDAVTLTVTRFGRLSRVDAAAVREEGERLAAFAAGGAGSREVRIV